MLEHHNSSDRTFTPPPSMDFHLPPQTRFEKETSPLSKGFAIFLAVFAGVVGAHDFYLGYRKKGITKIIMLCLLIGGPINPVWALVDIFNMLTKSDFCDAQGRVLK